MCESFTVSNKVIYTANVKFCIKPCAALINTLPPISICIHPSYLYSPVHLIPYVAQRVKHPKKLGCSTLNKPAILETKYNIMTGAKNVRLISYNTPYFCYNKK
jgi:hypothetical protein